MSEGRNQSLRLSSKSNKLVPRDISESLGKRPPQALDLEEAVLGAMILERAGLIQGIDVLKPDDFYIEAHKTIYQAIMDLFKASEPVDMRTVVNQLRKSGHLELVGGMVKIAELTADVQSSANIESHARIVAEMAIRRRLISMGMQITQESYEDTQDVFITLEHAQKQFDQVAGLYLSGNVKVNKVVFDKTIQALIAGRDKKGLTGVPSGYTGLDRLTAGWQKTELTIIAGRPGMGKTAFVTNILRNAAVDFNIPVAIFSLEMSDTQLEQRLISSESEIELDKIRRCNYSDVDFTRIVHMTNKLAAAPLYIDDTAAISTLELRAKCRRLKAEHNVQLFVVDYLQLMRGDEKSGNREQEISSISRALKGIAKDLDVPVIGLSQLSRSVETRGGDKRPQLSDLRESGAIEQDADIVMFLFRPEYYKITVYEDGMPTQGTMEVIIAKHRNGSCDTVKVKFIGKYGKVMDFDDQELFTSAPVQPPPGNFKLYKNNQVSRNEHGDDEPLPAPKNDDETPF